jgi:hypothetical protein
MNETSVMTSGRRLLLSMALTVAGAGGCSQDLAVGVQPGVAPALPYGTSVSAACDPTAPAGVSTIAEGLSGNYTPLHLAGDTLYFAVQAGIMKMPLAGGAPTLLNTNADPYPGDVGLSQYQGQQVALDLVVVGSTVYVLAAEGIFSVPAEGGPTTLLHKPALPWDAGVQLAADTASLYWHERRFPDSTGPAEGRLMTMLLDGGAATFVASLGPQLGTGIAVDDASLFWTQATGTPGGAEVWRMPKGGGTATTIATDPKGGLRLVVDGGHVYWRDGWTAMMAPKTGSGTATSFGVGESEPRPLTIGAAGVAVNAASIFWIEDTFTAASGPVPAGGKLMRASLSGGAEEVVATLDGPVANRPIACPGGVCWTQANPEASIVSLLRYNACP